MKIAIYWKCHRRAKDNICEHLHINGETKVSGETEINLPDNHPTIDELNRLEAQGWIKVRRRHTLKPDDYYMGNIHRRTLCNN